MRHKLSHLSVLVLGPLVLAAVPAAAAAAPAADSVQGALNAVACTSPASCTAVGSYVSAAGQVSLAEGWDGSAWTVQPTPNPAGAFSTALDGVACGSAGACLAVGHYTYGSEGQDLG